MNMPDDATDEKFMKILFMNVINRSYVIMPSIGLGYLAAIAADNGHDVSILNCVKERMTYEHFKSYISGEQFDIIGLQIFSYDLNSARKHLEIIRECLPAAITVAGGAHPSGDPHGVMSYLDILDFAFQGEAEIGFPILVDRIIHGNTDFTSVPGLVWRNGVTTVANPKAFVQDLSTLPFPAWELLQPETYPEAPHGAFTRSFPTAPIMVTRGCPSGCIFCAGHAITGRCLRKRSIENVIAELKLLAKRGILEFHIEDENFTESREYVFDFCRRLSAEKLGMSWSLPSGIRLDTIDREMIEAMAGAGCYSLAVGIESGSDRVLKLMRKGLTVDDIVRQMKFFKNTGIKVTGFFMLGIPGETTDEMQQTIRFALKLPLDRAQFNIFMPLPGSAVWQQLAKAGKLKDLAWDKFFVHDVAFPTDSISSKKIKSIHRAAVLKFYLRPRIIFALLLEIRSIRHLMYVVKRTLDTII